MVPDDLRYTRDHEWVRIEGDKAVIGITDYAQSELGDIIFIEFPSIGDKFVQNDYNLNEVFFNQLGLRKPDYSIKVKKEIRDKLVKYLAKKEIETRLSFPPVHIQPFYKNKYK